MQPETRFLIEFVTSSWTRLPPNLRGILWLLMGTLAFAVNDLFVKSLGQTMSPFQMAFFRYGIGFALMLPFLMRMGVGELKTSRPGIHIVRLILACVAQVGVYTSVVYLLADATALAFSRILLHHGHRGDLPARDRQRASVVRDDCRFRGCCRHGAPRRRNRSRRFHSDWGRLHLCDRKCSDPDHVDDRTAQPDPLLSGGRHLAFLPPTVVLWQTPPDLVSWLMALAIGFLTTIGMIGFIRGLLSERPV